MRKLTFRSSHRTHLLSLTRYAQRLGRNQPPPEVRFEDGSAADVMVF